MLESVVLIRFRQGWLGFIRYSNPLLNQNIACNTRWELDRKVDYILKRNEVSWRG